MKVLVAATELKNKALDIYILTEDKELELTFKSIKEIELHETAESKSYHVETTGNDIILTEDTLTVDDTVYTLDDGKHLNNVINDLITYSKSFNYTYTNLTETSHMAGVNSIIVNDVFDYVNIKLVDGDDTRVIKGLYTVDNNVIYVNGTAIVVDNNHITVDKSWYPINTSKLRFRMSLDGYGCKDNIVQLYLKDRTENVLFYKHTKDKNTVSLTSKNYLFTLHKKYTTILNIRNGATATVPNGNLGNIEITDLNISMLVSEPDVIYLTKGHETIYINSSDVVLMPDKDVEMVDELLKHNEVHRLEDVILYINVGSNKHMYAFMHNQLVPVGTEWLIDNVQHITFSMRVNEEIIDRINYML